MTLGPKQKATAKAVAFCFGFRRPEGGFTLRYFNAQGGKAAPAQFPACGREFTRHSARGPEGPLGDSPATVLSIQNINFNCSFHIKEQSLIQKQPSKSEGCFCIYARKA